MLPVFFPYNERSHAQRKPADLYLAILFLPLLLLSCKKEKVPSGTASLIMINAVVGTQELSTNFKASGTVLFKDAFRLYYKTFNRTMNSFSAYSGQQPVRIFKYPDTTVKDKPLYDLVLDLPVNSISTLFLTGTVAQPDTLMIRDQIPYFPPGDSAMAVRFVNVSPGSAAISINLAGQPAGSEAVNLAYKGVSAFKNYPVRKFLPDYVFEVRDAATGTLITTYTTKFLSEWSSLFPNAWIFRSFTIGLAGIPGGTGTEVQSTFLTTHY